ncbi:transcription initiation factor IIB [Allomyces arbusculus]|nr:transcription initiation factor IIB [Allomyces arbusculus]
MNASFYRTAQQGSAPDLLPAVADGTNAHAAAAKYRQVTAKQQIDLNVRLICNYCLDPVPNLVEDFQQGDLICGDCGTVFQGRIIDTRPEWRTFADDGGDDPSRVGAAENPLLGAKLGLETRIGGGKFAPDHRKLAWTHATTSLARSEKVLLDGFRAITAMGERMGLNRKLIDASKQFFVLIDRAQPIKKMDETVAVAVLLGCRECGVDRPLQEVADLIKKSKHELGKVLFQAKKALQGMPHNDSPSLTPTASPAPAGTNTAVVNASTLSRRYCSALGLSMPVSSAVVAVCDRAYTITELSSRNPKTIVGAAIYLLAHLHGQPVEMTAVASIVKMTVGTLRQAYRIMRANLDTMLPDELRAMSTAMLPTN